MIKMDENAEYKDFEEAIRAVRDIEIETNSQFVVARKTKTFNTNYKY